MVKTRTSSSSSVSRFSQPGSNRARSSDESESDEVHGRQYEPTPPTFSSAITSERLSHEENKPNTKHHAQKRKRSYSQSSAKIEMCDSDVKMKPSSKRSRGNSSSSVSTSNSSKRRRSKRSKPSSPSSSSPSDVGSALKPSAKTGTSAAAEKTLITPSPILRSLPVDVKTDGIVVDLQMGEEDVSSRLSSGSASLCSLGSIDFHKLPQHVYSILCPYLSGDNTKCSCGCMYEYDDSSSSSLTEKFFAVYSPEYIQSLHETELNIEHVLEDSLPVHLKSNPYRRLSKRNRSPLSSSSFGESTSSTRRRRSPRLLEKADESSRSCCDESHRTSLDVSDSDNSSISSTSKPITQKTSREGSSSNSSKVSCFSSSSSSSKSPLAFERYQWHMDYISRNEYVTEHMRAVLIDWLIEVAEEYKIASVTLHTAVALVDRCLASCVIAKNAKWEKSCEKAKKKERKLVVDRNTFQLLGCGCMLIACKMHEVDAPQVKDFCYISAGTYKSSEITEMELDICTLLCFNLHITTPHHFAQIYTRASYVSGPIPCQPACSMAQDDIMALLVEYFLEISMLQYSFVMEKPSKVAAAAVYLARATLDIRDASDPSDVQCTSYFSKTLKWYSQYEAADLKDVVMRLHLAHSGASDANLKSVFEKWKKSSLKKVALKLPALKDILSKSFVLQ